MSQTSMQTSHESTYRTPRWVKLFVIIALAVLLLVAVVLATGIGGEHGPGRHSPSISVTQEHASPMNHGEQLP
jgi:ABC-type transporter Mla subunit MlaD